MGTYKGMQIIENTEDGYDRVYLPTHPYAHKDGLIYLHHLIAEDYLGRYLNGKEVVHHIDFNKKNNVISNLMVFATLEMHDKFHKALQYDKNVTLMRIDKVWYVYDNTQQKDNICPKCGGLKDKGAFICRVCYLKQQRYRIPSRNVLIQDLMTLPMIQIGQKYGVSDNAVRKWCKSYGLPFKYSDICNYKNQRK